MMAQNAEGFGARTATLVYSITAGQLASTILTLITFIAITRMLQPANYGLYSFAFGFSTLIDAFAAFGVGAYFATKLSIYSIKKDREEIFNVVRSGYAVLIPIAIFLTLLGIALSPLVASLASGINIQAATLMFASATIFFLMIQGASTQALIGFGKPWLSSFVGASTNLVQLVASVGLIYYGYGVNGAIAGMLIGYIYGTVLGVYYMYKFASEYGKLELFIPPMKKIKAAFDYSAPIGINKFLTTALQNFSIILLGIYLVSVAGQVTLGNYGAAIKGYNFLFFVYQTMTTILIPAFSIAIVTKAKKHLHGSYNDLLRYSMLLTLPLIVYPAVFAGPGIYLFISQSYSTAAIYLTLISIGTGIGIINAYLDSLMLAEGKTRKTMVYNIESSIIQLVLLLILVPLFYYRYGSFASVLGAIVAVFFIGNIISNVLFMNGVKKEMKIKLEERSMLNIFLCNIALGILLAAFLLGSNVLLAGLGTDLLDIMQLAAGIVLVLVFYPILMAAFGLIRRKDIEVIRAATKKLPLMQTAIAVFTNYTERFAR
jgi:O-antigen/teichoic acid export membrane protein